MNDGELSSTTPSPGGTAAQHDTLPPPPSAGPGPATPPRPDAGTRRPRWSAGGVTALVIGAVVALFSVMLLGVGGTVLWADLTQRDAGYVTTDVHDFSAAGSALSTDPTELGSSGTGWLYAPGLLDRVRIRVTPATSGSSLFVGIGRAADVDRYLAGVSHTVITDLWTDKVEVVNGGASASAPGGQDFWVASATGPGTQSVVWDPTDGSWTVVVMNADGRPGVDVNADLGARIPALRWIAVGFLAAGAVFAVGGALLIAGAIRGRRAGTPKAA